MRRQQRKPKSILLAAALAALLPASAAFAQSSAKRIQLEVTNPSDFARPDAPIVVKVPELKRAAADFDAKAFVVTAGDAEAGDKAASVPVASQADDLDGDGSADEVAFVLDLAPKQKRSVTIHYGDESAVAPLRVEFPKRARAIFAKKYEGMGWESDRVAWRVYFDERNATDLFGKRQPCLALEYFAQKEVDYHAESPIGRDIYKNGDAVGIGSIAAWVDGKPVKVGKVKNREYKVRADGPVRAVADLIYTGWQAGDQAPDITSRLTIWAGSQGFWHEVFLKNGDGVQLVTAIPIKPNVPAVVSDSQPAYLATWGHQVLIPGKDAVDSLPDQNLGLAICMPGAAPDQITGIKDPNNHVVKVPLKQQGDAAHGRYFVLAMWDQEAPSGQPVAGLDPAAVAPRPVQSMEAWERYVKQQAEALAAELKVVVQSGQK